MLEWKTDIDFSNVRLDKFLRKKLPSVPVSHLFKMIRTKKVRVNGKRAQPDQPLAEGDVVTVRGDAEKLLQTVPEEERKPPPIDLSLLQILYEDDWMMVIDKPSGLAVHPGSGIHSGTVVDLVRAYLGPKAFRNDFGASPAHRLDRETSGLLVVAKRRPAMVHFTEVFTHHRAKKKYLALVKGKMKGTSGLIDLPLSEHQQTQASKMRRGVNMQPARTRWRLLKQGGSVALVECVIETGRTHQIRRHFAALGHPVAGDRKHGDFQFNREAKAQWKLDRLFLHAAHLEVPHPEDGRKMSFSSDLAVALTEVLKAVGVEAP
jgi:23S rRNA pseudouridine955/2504/2580 synthase